MKALLLTMTILTLSSISMAASLECKSESGQVVSYDYDAATIVYNEETLTCRTPAHTVSIATCLDSNDRVKAQVAGASSKTNFKILVGRSVIGGEGTVYDCGPFSN